MATALRALKLSMLNVSSALGLFRMLRNSRWRASQLLILCYHGISLEDEHEWAPGLFMSQDAFAARLELLKRRGCTVLALDEGVRRLYDGTLPPRSVVITFDDGNFDFLHRALPLLRAYGYPATVYLTTYYSEVNVPVFPLVVSYLLWKARRGEYTLTLSYGTRIALDTRSDAGRRRAHQRLIQFAQDEDMSAATKDRLAEQLADVLGMDYGEIRRKRLLHLMTADEVREIASAGIDVQMHTHRHRSPPSREQYRDEIVQNRVRIAPLTGRTPRHFCYPSGVCQPGFAEWLGEEGVVSATTCEPGIASAGSDRFELPRLLDHSDMTPIEFDAWLTGLGALLPHRPLGFSAVDEKGRLTIGPTNVVPTPAHTMESGT